MISSVADDLCMLDEIALFNDLTSDQLSNLKNLLHQKTFPAGAIIMAVEQMGEVVYVIASGTVKVHVEQEDGTDVIISILGKGDIVGEMSLLDDAGRCASVVTLEETHLFWMDRMVFNNCLREMPVLTYNLACILSNRLRTANEHIQALAACEVESRVARQILSFASVYGQSTPEGATLIPIRLTQSDIAGLVGASRERTNKVIVSYKERKYISVDQNYHITIHNRNALVRRCL